MKYRFPALCTVLLLCLMASGCMIRQADELYALPRQSEEYYDLQAAIDEVLDANMEYCAPLSGDNQQAVQLADVNGDGVDEAIAFFRASGDKPLKLCIFVRQEDHYEQLTMIEGDGSDFVRVDYCPIDNEPGDEIVVARMVSDQAPQVVTIYSFGGGRLTELLTVSNVRHTVADLNSDGLQDLLVLRTDSEQPEGIAELYSWRNEAFNCIGTANMMVPLRADSVCRIVSGLMQEDIPAVFVASYVDDEMLQTDVFALRSGGFFNITMLAERATGAYTIRYRNFYGTDIDGDGLIELPSTQRLQHLNEEDSAGEHYVTNWYNLTVNGRKVYRQSTYHNYTDGWYLELPESWDLNLVVDYVTDENGYDGYKFYHYENDTVQVQWLFTIYAFSGSNAEELAQSNGRFLLSTKGDVVYSALLRQGEPLDGLTEDGLKELFHFIYTDWNTGEFD